MSALTRLSHRAALACRRADLRGPETECAIANRALRLDRCARDHRHGTADPRTHVGVDERRRLFAQTEIFAVLDNADDLYPRTGGACVAETFAQGRLTRPEPARKSLVDHGDILLGSAILLREIAALY